MRHWRTVSADELNAGPPAAAGSHGGGGVSRMSLLPFLDIIFGTIGIFVVTFALQNLVEVKEGIPPGVDAIVTCIDGDRLAAHWPDGSSGAVAAPARTFDLLQALAADGRPFRSVILALSGHCIKARSAFLTGFERYLDVSTRSAAGASRAPIGLMLELYPIGGASDAEALLDEWRGGPSDERRRI